MSTKLYDGLRIKNTKEEDVIAKLDSLKPLFKEVLRNTIAKKISSEYFNMVDNVFNNDNPQLPCDYAQNILKKYGNVREAIKNYKNGKKNGSQEDFYDNGQLQEKRNIENGELVLHQTFDQEGNPLIDLTYINGKKNGLQEVYFETGQLQRSNYKDGEPDGLWEKFDEEGNLLTIGEYKDGELIE